MSSTSSICARRSCADVVMVSTISRCASERSVSRRISAIAITPFSGVRISWLTFATNRPFARLASSARRLASLMRSASTLT
jgi:hypothetical protein